MKVKDKTFPFIHEIEFLPQKNLNKSWTWRCCGIRIHWPIHNMMIDVWYCLNNAYCLNQAADLIWSFLCKCSNWCTILFNCICPSWVPSSVKQEIRKLSSCLPLLSNVWDHAHNFSLFKMWHTVLQLCPLSRVSISHTNTVLCASHVCLSLYVRSAQSERRPHSYCDGR